MSRKNTLIIIIALLIIGALLLLFTSINRSNTHKASEQDISQLIIDQVSSDNEKFSVNVDNLTPTGNGWYVGVVVITFPDDHTDEEVKHTGVAVVYKAADLPPEMVISPVDYYYKDELSDLVSASAVEHILKQDVENIIEEDGHHEDE